MLYQRPKFSVPATEGKGDCSQGHMEPDRRGKCLRCGERVESPSQALREYADSIGGTIVHMSESVRISPEVANAISSNPDAFKAMAKARLDEATAALNQKYIEQTYGWVGEDGG